MEPWWWWHGMGFMWIFPMIFMVVCLILFFIFLFRGPRWFHHRGYRSGDRETARDILDRRFASGEITKEQYDEMKRVLSSS